MTGPHAHNHQAKPQKALPIKPSRVVQSNSSAVAGAEPSTRREMVAPTLALATPPKQDTKDLMKGFLQAPTPLQQYNESKEKPPTETSSSSTVANNNNNNKNNRGKEEYPPRSSSTIITASSSSAVKAPTATETATESSPKSHPRAAPIIQFDNSYTFFEKVLVFVNILIFAGILFTCFVFARVYLQLHRDESAQLLETLTRVVNDSSRNVESWFRATAAQLETLSLSLPQIANDLPLHLEHWFREAESFVKHTLEQFTNRK